MGICSNKPDGCFHIIDLSGIGSIGTGPVIDGDHCKTALEQWLPISVKSKLFHVIAKPGTAVDDNDGLISSFIHLRQVYIEMVIHLIVIGVVQVEPLLGVVLPKTGKQVYGSQDGCKQYSFHVISHAVRSIFLFEN